MGNRQDLGPLTRRIQNNEVLFYAIPSKIFVNYDLPINKSEIS